MKGYRGATARIAALVLAAVVCAAMIIITYGNVRFGDSTRYAAMFTDASGLKAGDDVRVAGVTVGRVSSVTLGPDHLARVDFSVSTKTPIMVGSRGAIRYKNLIGQRFVELTRGAEPSRRLAEGGVIPVGQTRPALDLDELYNGFSPLFEGLQPAQVNELSGSLINVLQGQSGSVTALLSQVSTLTSSLADRDAVIGSVITNLNGVLGTVNQRGDQTSELVNQLQQLISGLNSDRAPLGDSLARIDRLTGTVDDLFKDARPDLKGTITEVRRVSELINSDSPRIESLLRKVPGYYQILGRLGIYQQGFQFYLCGVQIRIATPGAPPLMTDMLASQEKRCQY